MRPAFQTDEWDWPLPGVAYLPGRTTRPDADDDVHRIARAAPDPTDPRNWAQNAAWLAGLRLYREGFFWEAHEVWEPVWMNAQPNSRERLLIQGLIQMANAALKQRMARNQAAIRLAAMSAQLIAEASHTETGLMGVDVRALARSAERYHQCLGGNPDQAMPPRICII